MKEWSITDFTNSKEVYTIFEEAAIFEFSQVIFNLELYKFSPRVSIISVLNDSEEFADIVADVDNIKRNAKFSQIERKFGILVDCSSNTHVTVCYEVNRTINKDAIELAMEKYKIKYLALTPYNYRELADSGKMLRTYEPNIMFKRILLEALNLQATDLHFCVDHVGLHPTYPIKYRKDGNLYRMDLFELTAELNKSIISNLVEMQTDVNSLDLITPAGVTAVSDDPLGNGEVELRIAANKVKNGWQCVIRIQKKETFNFNIEGLGFPDDVQESLYDLTTKRNGIVFITGAIRTGKNTTAFAVLNEIVKQPVKIVSYESPIEALMPFTQIDYGGDVDTLLNAVRLAKKQDVNIAYINELPNSEVAFAVQDLANSSIYVITTMHMNRLWHLPYKLYEYYGPQYRDIISQINAVYNQKMFGVTCPECQDSILVESLKPKHCEFLKARNIHSVKVNKGCALCQHTGLVPGRNQPYVEFLNFTSDLKDRLLACELPFQMEQILKEEVLKTNNALEDRLSTAISEGVLSVDALDHIL